jgi:hypothetical protein
LDQNLDWKFKGFVPAHQGAKGFVPAPQGAKGFVPAPQGLVNFKMSATVIEILKPIAVALIILILVAKV